MKISEIRVNGFTCPTGLDEVPELSWKLEADEGQQNIVQTAYRIRVREADPSEDFSLDSGWVETWQSTGVWLSELSRKPGSVYEVCVEVRNNYDETARAMTCFETGILAGQGESENQWPGTWITHTFPQEDTTCPVFTCCIRPRRDCQILTARAYITALGVYDFAVNGEKVGNAFLAPGWTAYEKRLQYQTYDFTEQLRTGIKDPKEMVELEILTGNGWYKGYLNGAGKNCWYGDRVAVSGVFRILYADGTTDVFTTDECWSVRKSNILYSELYHGEIQEIGRNTADSEWDGPEESKPAVRFTGTVPSEILAQQCEPVRITDRISAVKKIITPKGETVLDFGQNIAGFVELHLPKLLHFSGAGKDGSEGRLVIRHAETLDRDGNFYTENLRTARATDIYCYAENAVGRMVRPHFTYHGFRYIAVEGAGENINSEDFTACVLHTDLRPVGSFSCSNPQVQRLMENVRWSQRDNFVDIPTDCPQRDERLGWTGDAEIFAPTAVLNYDTANFYRKWMRDLMAESDEAAGVPQMVPQFEGRSIGTSVWGDAATVIPWTVYEAYGDRSILEEQYPNMRLWVDWITKQCDKSCLWMSGFQRGDWLSLDGDESLHAMYGGTDRNLVASCYYARSLRIVRDSAGILQNRKDEIHYGALYNKVKHAINREYVTANGRLVSETQTACVLLLHFELLEEKYKPRVQRILADNLRQHQGHLTTGFIGTAFLLPTLTENGMQNQAKEILLSEDYPGWLYAVKKGATTIWERWNSILPDGSFDQSGMNSLNHYSYGSVGQWLYQTVGGISPLEAGYHRIRIAPVLTKTMEEVNSSFDSVYGRISCHLLCREGRVVMDVTIPANTTAEIVLPGRTPDASDAERIHEVGSGTYHFSYETDVHLKPEKYTLNTRIDELLKDPSGKAVFDRFLPGMADGPAAAFLRGKTFNDLIAVAPQQKEVLEQVLAAANAG